MNTIHANMLLAESPVRSRPKGVTDTAGSTGAIKNWRETLS